MCSGGSGHGRQGNPLAERDPAPEGERRVALQHLPLLVGEQAREDRDAAGREMAQELGRYGAPELIWTAGPA